MLARPFLGILFCFSTLLYGKPATETVKLIIPHSERQGLNSEFETVFQKVKVTPILKTSIENRIQTNFNVQNNSQLPHQYELGMNGVPVLNQGRNGSCVTFAQLALIDVLKGGGDYYSQLCLLNLGNYLQSQGFGVSGWNGIDFKSNFHRILEFGLVPKQIQTTLGCAGDKNYPIYGISKPNLMSLAEYHEKSEKIFFQFISEYKNLFKISNDVLSDVDINKMMERTKKHITLGHRVLIGMYMPANSSLALDANYKKDHDTWVLTEKLKNQVHNDLNFWNQIVGHAMLITGYDDDALIKDKMGGIHYGAFKVRNSWGKYAGDHGDYYITYDYFKTFVGELWTVI